MQFVRFFLVLAASTASAFVVPRSTSNNNNNNNNKIHPRDLALAAVPLNHHPQAAAVVTTRRATLAAAAGAAAVVAAGFQSSSTACWAIEQEDDPTATTATATTATTTKVLVLGGTGFVGSRVVQKLKAAGIQVVATSRDGRDGTVALDILATNDLSGRVKSLSAGCQSVVACWGAFGTPNDARINAASGLAAIGAKQAGVHRFVTLGVAPEVVQAISGLVSQLQGYLDGKEYSKKTITATYATGDAIFIEPTFIYGGDKFALKPPRVAGFYGSFIEGLLASPPVRFVEGVLPKGNIIEVALEPPVSVDAVASAAVAGALGKLRSTPVLDTHDKIKQASELLL